MCDSLSGKCLQIYFRKTALDSHILVAFTGLSQSCEVRGFIVGVGS